ncbi:WD40-repeat-containing domain protein [Lanmaoa asiatica]|nr:WD40-repeat-containing domain protein [Lanmaoa asiatica]
MQGKVIEVEDSYWVGAVDVSPDSTRFATATGSDKTTSIWSITSGERLVGPLEHKHYVRGIKFTPTGEHIAIACHNSFVIRIFNSGNGNKLIMIRTLTPICNYPSTPLAWSNNGQQIFTPSKDKKITSFDVWMGFKIAESQVLGGNEITSIALAANGKFIAAYTSRFISFLDASTLSHIHPVIEDSEDISSIAISADSSYLATGRRLDGKIVIRNLGSILPDFYGPFNVSTREQTQLTSGDYDNLNLPDSTQEQPGKPSSLESKSGNENGDDVILEVEVPSSAPQFDFDEVGDHYILVFPSC